MMPQYKLTYFDFRGTSEPIRLCLAQAGIPFEDVRLKYSEFAQHKSKMPFGQLPVLEIDGRKLTQSFAIMRYIARKHGLEADDEWDRALGDELATSWFDIFARIHVACEEKEKAAKIQSFQTMIEEFIKPRLKITNERLSHNKSGYIAGFKVRWCDFSVYNAMVIIRDYLKVSLNEYKDCQRFVEIIEALPKVKEWQSKHPNARFITSQTYMDRNVHDGDKPMGSFAFLDSLHRFAGEQDCGVSIEFSV